MSTLIREDTLVAIAAENEQLRGALTALESQCKQLRQALKGSEQERQKAQQLAQGMTHAIAHVHEEYAGAIARLQEQGNRVALRVESLTGKVKELTARLDKTNNHVQGLPQREEFEDLVRRLSFVEGRTLV